ncbi:MAG: Gfo/Idh/MocA family oxidoreductase [Lachnospiraceae bacterium]|nr:Gfo/Idh/MocA family oxidoreductase [Lachnospiraceae bacterium]
MGKVLNLGIMGAGGIAGTMAGTVNKMENVKCYAVASRTQEKADAFGQKFDVEKCYGSYEEMLADEKVDLVYVATPHSEHYENMKQCIRYKKPILCEKAFTANAAQAKEVLALAKEAGVLVAEAMWIRYMPMYKTIKEVLEGGIIGEVKMVNANLGYNISHVERLMNPALAGGALLDLGVYTIHFASMILGTDVEKIESSCDLTDTGVDKQESITIHYKNGSMAVLNASMCLMSDRIGGIFGTKGYAVVENINNFETLTVYNNQYQKVAYYEAPKQISGYEYEVEACAKALEKGLTECPEMPHAETLRIMQIMDGLREDWGVKYPFEA